MVNQCRDDSVLHDLRSMPVASRVEHPPTRVQRDAALPLDGNGCVICPTEQPSCPVCPHGQQCNQVSLTCSLCPSFVCVPRTKSAHTLPLVGAIVGGTVGALVLVVALAAFYFFYFRRRHTPHSDTALEELDSQLLHTLLSEKTPALGDKNRRLSAYELFMRPQTRTRGPRRAPQKPALAKRNSIATTISTTNASNILPVAYIPGVTVRPTKNNTRLIYLYDTTSVFSDLNAIEGALIVQDREATAVRAQAKLVNIERIDEEEETEANDTKGSSTQTAWELDLDVDSDIGEINRATSVLRPHEVLIDIGE